MAVDLTKLIDFNLLQRYDTKLKAWAEKKIVESNEIIFTTENSLPATGNMNLLYVTEDSIFLWDGSKYTKVGGQGTGTTFIPSIDANGDLTFTNDGGLPNPAPVNVRGPAGKSAYDIAVENGFEGTQEEWLDSLSAAGIQVKIVNELPETGEDKVLYFLPIDDGTHEEYMWVNDKWEMIGTTKVDLSDYYTKQQIDELVPDVIKRCVWFYAAGDDISLFAKDNTNVASFTEFVGYKPAISNNNVGIILVDNKLYWTKFNITAINENSGAVYQEFTQDPILIGPVDSVDVSDELITIKDTKVTNISQLPMDKLPCCLHMVNSTFYYEFNDDIIYVASVPGLMALWTMDGKIAYFTFNDDGVITFNQQTSFVDGTTLVEQFYNKDQIDSKLANINVDDELITIKDTSITNISQLPVDKLPCCFHMVNSDINDTIFKDDIIYISEVTLGKFSVYSIDGAMINIVCDDDGTLSFDKFLHWVDSEVLLNELGQYYNKNEIDSMLAGAGGDIDLSDYYTKEEVNSKIQEIELTPGPKGDDGPSIVSMRLDENLHLISTLSNGVEIDAGKIDVDGLTLEKTEVIDVKLMTDEIAFDGETTEFTLPVDSKTLMVYVNGLCLENGSDYTINEGTITFSEVFSETDKGILHWFDKNSADSEDTLWATKDDIDSMFE